MWSIFMYHEGFVWIGYCYWDASSSNAWFLIFSYICFWEELIVTTLLGGILLKWMVLLLLIALLELYEGVCNGVMLKLKLVELWPYTELPKHLSSSLYTSLFLIIVDRRVSLLHVYICDRLYINQVIIKSLQRVILIRNERNKRRKQSRIIQAHYLNM